MKHCFLKQKFGCSKIFALKQLMKKLFGWVISDKFSTFYTPDITCYKEKLINLSEQPFFKSFYTERVIAKSAQKAFYKISLGVFCPSKNMLHILFFLYCKITVPYSVQIDPHDSETKRVTAKCLKDRIYKDKRYKDKTCSVTKRIRTKRLKRHEV
jgi:hypothetical protein